MLNLYYKLSNKLSNKTNINRIDTPIYNKDFVSSIREIDNSIYSYNKNFLNFIPTANKIAIKLIKSYFNLYNIKLENMVKKRMIRKRKVLRLKRLSSNRIFLSNGTFKHTNNKIIINLFIYNRQKINYTYLLKYKFKKFLLKNLIKKLTNIKERISIRRNIIIKLLNNNKIKNKKNIIRLYNIKNKLYYKNIIKHINRKYKKYFVFKQLLYINKSKFNYNYLTYLNKIIKKIYNKNIEFNIINLKKFFFNSDITTQSLLLKITRNRRRINRKLKKLLETVKISKEIKNIEQDYIIDIKSKTINNTIKSFIKKKTIKKTVLDLMKYKKLSGIRIEAKGRLTKRATASKSIKYTKHNGALIIKNSLSSPIYIPIVKNTLKLNIQHTKLNSKTNIGSFGLKGWISGK
jgi:hypothetical protein